MQNIITRILLVRTLCLFILCNIQYKQIEKEKRKLNSRSNENGNTYIFHATKQNYSEIAHILQIYGSKKGICIEFYLPHRRKTIDHRNRIVASNEVRTKLNHKPI